MSVLRRRRGLARRSRPVDEDPLIFAGTGSPWITWALGDLAVKLAVGVGMLLPFRLLIARSLGPQPSSASS